MWIRRPSTMSFLVIDFVPEWHPQLGVAVRAKPLTDAVILLQSALLRRYTFSALEMARALNELNCDEPPVPPSLPAQRQRLIALAFPGDPDSVTKVAEVYAKPHTEVVDGLADDVELEELVKMGQSAEAAMAAVS